MKNLAAVDLYGAIVGQGQWRSVLFLEKDVPLSGLAGFSENVGDASLSALDLIGLTVEKDGYNLLVGR